MYRFLSALLTLFLALGSARALTPNQAVAVALSDLDTLAKEDQPFVRYLYLPMPATGIEYRNFVTAQRLGVNLISREAQLAYPLEVGPGVFRVDLRDYQWSVKVFDKLGDIDPYFHRNDVVTEIVTVTEDYYEWWPGGFWRDGCYYYPNSFQVQRQRQKRVKRQVVKRTLYVPQGAGQLASLVLLTDSNAPIVRADWFLVQTARQVDLRNRQTGAGYYDFLGLKTLDDYLRLIGQGKTNGNTIRAVVNFSGVTQNNRQVLREGAEFGGHWTTFEVVDQSGRGIAIQELRDKELNAAASEHYGPLPNGLPVTFLNNAQNVRQDSVPDNIASDKSPLNVSNDGRVHVNIACMRCHAGNVLQPIADDVRAVYTGRLQTITNDKGVALELQRQYGANLDRALARDRVLFQDAFTAATGKTAQQAAEIYTREFHRYATDPVTVDAIANELGVKAPQLDKALRDGASRLGIADFRSDPWIAPIKPRTVPRLTVEDSYIQLSDVLYGILQVDNEGRNSNPPKEKP